MRDNLAAHRERQRPPQTWRRIPNLARQAKGSEGDLHRSDNLLCEQRRNQSRLPSRVGRQDANAVGWGSEVVIVVGETSYQGARESRAQGEGPQNSMFQVNPRQAAVGRITKPISKELPDEQCRGRNGTPAHPGKIEFGTPGARKRARLPLHNRRGTALKILTFDGVGQWLCIRRFSRGRLQWWPTPQGSSPLHSLQAQQLSVLLYNGLPEQACFVPPWRELPHHSQAASRATFALSSSPL